jgi:2-dehydro-3-deoxyphosphogluconate aldolase/(4S)-4-hydroxy-2-oxoglutarate aldolase
MELRDKLAQVRIVPVIVIKDLAHAVPLARALVEGGLDVLEITLRSPVALDAIAKMPPMPAPSSSSAPA